MAEEVKQEVMELVVTACEKHSANNEVIENDLEILHFKIREL